MAKVERILYVAQGGEKKKKTIYDLFKKSLLDNSKWKKALLMLLLSNSSIQYFNCQFGFYESANKQRVRDQKIPSPNSKRAICVTLKLVNYDNTLWHQRL